MLELEASDLKVRMVVDRSRREVMVASMSAPNRWVDLGPVLTRLQVPNPGTAWPTFGEAVEALLVHRHEVAIAKR
jgi:hypothetical protein